jgi:hypothetical protein
MIPTMRAPLLTIALLIPAACSDEREFQRHELDEIALAHKTELAQFEAAQSAFAQRNPVPRRWDFPGEGTIIVDECSLEGFPEHEQLLLRFTYVNTTDHALDEARITLTLHDPDSGSRSSDELVLRLPLALGFSRDSSYTMSVHEPTHGIHLHPNWEWTITARAVVHPKSP